jgi:outer membrane protein TolC
MMRWYQLTALALGFASPLAAQDSLAPKPPVAATLSLADALKEARANSPAYRQTLNDAGPARWAVRNAYGNLLPTAQVSGGMGYTGSGQSQFGAFFNQTSAFVNSNYSIGLQWTLDGHTLTAPSQQKALRRATDEDIAGAGVTLTQQITGQYLTALQAAAQVDVAREQVRRNTEFLRLARARYQVGSATLLDVRQAEVTKGRSEVTLLRAIQTDNEAKLELLRLIGIEPKVAVEQLALSDSFPVEAPSWQLSDLLHQADEANPALRSLRAREGAAGTAVKAAKAEYLPRLFAQAGWSGFTQQYTNTGLLLQQSLSSAQSQASQCQFDNQVRTGLNLGGQTPDCFAAAGLDPTGSALLDPVSQQIEQRNNVFPFRFQGQPFQASLTLSLPIFTGFGRNLHVAQARAQQQDAEESVRAQSLAVHSSVNAQYLAVQTAYRTIAVQGAARDAAREQVRLAEERYRLGSGTSLEVTDAQNAVQQAEGDYVNAVYDYHKAVAALEAAVGRPLRQ